MHRRSLWILAILAVSLVVARGVARWAIGAEAGAEAARWIWAEQSGEPGTPAAFFLYRDFDLDFAATEATVSLVADEEYQIGLNTPAFAVGTLRNDAEGRARLDRYRVEGVLRQGTNRLWAEVRSSRGAGGLLARLEVLGASGERLLVASDDQWRVGRELDADGIVPSDEPPVVWGASPSGRWWTPAAPTEDTLTLRHLQGGTPVRPRPAERWRRPRETWHKAESYKAPPIGRWVTFDFGEEKTGFLNLAFADREASLGFVYYSLRKPVDGIDSPDEVVLRTRGRHNWAPSRPARFRFVTVVGSPAITKAEVLPIALDLAGDRLDREPVESLFGVERKRTLVAPVEDEVRRQLEGFPGLAGRKEG